MNTTDIIIKEFPTANINLLIEQGIDDIAIIKGYEDIETPEEYYKTYMDSEKPRTPATYCNDNSCQYPNDNYCQCPNDRSRSFTDLYAIVRAKFQDLTLGEFAYIFVKYQENGDKQFYCSYCSTVRKIVNKCHKSHTNIIPAHWVLSNGVYIFNENLPNYVSNLDLYTFTEKSGEFCDGVHENIILKLANSYLKSKNDETTIIKD